VELLRFFEISRLPPSWIIEIVKFIRWRVQRVKTHQHTKFCQNRSISWPQDIKIFRLFKKADVCHLAYHWANLDNPERLLGGLYHCAKFCNNRCSNL